MNSRQLFPFSTLSTINVSVRFFPRLILFLFTKISSDFLKISWVIRVQRMNASNAMLKLRYGLYDLILLAFSKQYVVCSPLSLFRSYNSSKRISQVKKREETVNKLIHNFCTHFAIFRFIWFLCFSVEMVEMGNIWSSIIR